ncbi:hypothetical protein AX17_004805 [Amanita inopinata Kibby_2008]|nr:hypothetical protein AX17_004805 [Amanita inopinata Kibby_2008]
MNATHLILAGSFRSISLFLLAFSPLDRSLSLVQTVDGFGPHQYLATNPRKDRVYTTTWSLPPTLQSWAMDRSSSTISHVNTVPITATSSYIAVPPPFTHIYSAGGPTGEVHTIDQESGGFGKKVQQILFVPEDQLETADKTRVALRHGSHGVELSSASGHAFIPVLGTNSIEMYKHDATTGHLTHLSSTPSPRGPQARDGPRHVKIHPNGQVVYCVAEHSNYVDAYTITPTSLAYLSSRSLLPPSLSDYKNSTQFRGDTLLLAPSTANHPAPHALFATTRGSTTSVRGWISVFALDEKGHFLSSPPASLSPEKAESDVESGVERFETPTSGGKANAIDILPKSSSSSSRTGAPVYNVDDLRFDSEPQSPLDTHEAGDAVWIALTDDDDSTVEGGGGVRVLEWNGWGTGGFKEVTSWPGPLSESQDSKGERMHGGSHAVWLS